MAERVMPDQSAGVIASEGGPREFAAAYLSLRADIWAYATRMLANDADAEDLTVATFEKVLRAWDRRPPDDELRPWIFRIATNTCLDELRRRSVIRWQPWNAFISLFHPSQVAPDDPAGEVVRHEDAALVRQALARLNPRDRAALVLRECHDVSVLEISETLGISRGAAKVALFRARERLRAAYLELGGEIPTSNRPKASDTHA